MRERKNVYKQFDRLMEREAPADPGIDAQEFAKRYGMTVDCAGKKLQRMAAAGRLIRGKRKNKDGRVVYVYSVPES